MGDKQTRHPGQESEGDKGAHGCIAGMDFINKAFASHRQEHAADSLQLPSLSLRHASPLGPAALLLVPLPHGVELYEHVGGSGGADGGAEGGWQSPSQSIMYST